MDALRAPAIFTGFLLLTLVCAPVQWVALKLALPARTRIPVFYHRMLCRLIGIRIRVVGTPIKEGGLMLANHNGWLDIVLLSSLSPLSFVAKSEVNDWPLFGLLARLQRTIFVRRGEKRRAASDRDAIRDRLKAGEILVIFAEGTSSDGNRVLPFKSALVGAAELPLENSGPTRHAPVQPVSIAYVASYGIPMGRETRPLYAWYGDMDLLPHLWGVFATGPLDVVIEFPPPVTVDEVGGRKQLASHAEGRVRAGLMHALHGAQMPSVLLAEAHPEDEEEAA